MNYFKYIVRASNGKILNGWVQAENEEKAHKTLEQRGYSVVLLEKYRGGVKAKISRETLMTTLRELATLRQSGMQLDECLESLIETTVDKNLVLALKRMKSDISSGSSLSDSVVSLPDIFPYYVSPMLRLGEENGSIHESLISIAERVEREEKIVSEVKTALTYPVFLLVVCVTVVFFLFLYVIPNFKSMITDEAAAAGSSLVQLISVSDFISDHITIILVLIVLIISAFIYGIKYGTLYEKILALLLKLPFFSTLFSAWVIVQFSGSMQKLLESGVELVDAVELSANAMSGEKGRRDIQRVIQRVKEGERLADALATYNVFPLVVIRLIKTGEVGASLPICFKEINTLYERRLSKGIKQILSILEPLVIVIMGTIVGSIMVILISGIISVNDIGW
ncbi:type II secretion system F family protein [Aeromonas hydrophila]|uniref:type II secretion system F family protein n=1 Tax=Aeromonas hydrophila TaxID=644 RepID=UPI00256F0BCF|nr:type II secretion system F family protein [Aeromonas hydrophila]MDL5383809.1 type II secretion system F family protein [Aeromonas hydrophila]